MGPLRAKALRRAASVAHASLSYGTLFIEMLRANHAANLWKACAKKLFAELVRERATNRRLRGDALDMLVAETKRLGLYERELVRAAPTGPAPGETRTTGPDPGESHG